MASGYDAKTKARSKKINFVRGVTVTVTGVAKALPGGLDSDDNLRRVEVPHSQAGLALESLG